MAICNSVQNIASSECIGDSLVKINNNFSNLNNDACTLLTLINQLSSELLVPKPGTVVQTVTKQVNATGDVSASIPITNTIPTITQGYELMTATITPKYTNSKIVIWCKPVANDSVNSGAYLKGTTFAAVFRNDQTNALFVSQTGGLFMMNAPFVYQDIAGTVNPITYSIRVGGESGTVKLGASYIGASTTRADYFFGTAGTISTLVIQEIKS